MCTQKGNILIGLIICSFMIGINEGVACQNDCGVCHVDCSDNVERACRRTHETILEQTLELTIEAYTKSNDTLESFRELLNDTYTPFFVSKYNNCTTPEPQDKANFYNLNYLCIIFCVVINLFMVQIV